MKECTGLAMAETVDGSPTFSAEQQFIFVRLNVLREYLERELQMPGIPFKYDFERAIDDWVFMCFFVGNDFLPHLPSLEIREGAIDRLVGLYKKTVHKTGVCSVNNLCFKICVPSVVEEWSGVIDIGTFSTLQNGLGITKVYRFEYSC